MFSLVGLVAASAPIHPSELVIHQHMYSRQEGLEPIGPCDSPHHECPPPDTRPVKVCILGLSRPGPSHELGQLMRNSGPMVSGQTYLVI